MVYYVYLWREDWRWRRRPPPCPSPPLLPPITTPVHPSPILRLLRKYSVDLLEAHKHQRRILPCQEIAARVDIAAYEFPRRLGVPVLQRDDEWREAVCTPGELRVDALDRQQHPHYGRLAVLSCDEKQSRPCTGRMVYVFALLNQLGN